MKSLDDKFFDSQKINNLRAIIGGGNTCLMCSHDGHIIHDGDRSDPDMV
ncbi:hypothetical protein [Aquimarina megaterium]|nr:hypothetical protein [Aquimarina megaterium]